MFSKALKKYRASVEEEIDVVKECTSSGDSMVSRGMGI